MKPESGQIDTDRIEDNEPCFKCGKELGYDECNTLLVISKTEAHPICIHCDELYEPIPKYEESK